MSKRGLTGITESRTIESLQKALDRTYRQMLKAAQEDWQLLFGGYDPADNCVTVRTKQSDSNDELSAAARS